MSSAGLPDLPRFKVEARLGVGGMGEVYRVFDREYETSVALKLLRLANSGDSIQRFKNEFRYLQAVRHPNLVRFFEFMEHEGKWFFTMELIDGVNFLDWVRPSPNKVGMALSTDATQLLSNLEPRDAYADSTTSTNVRIDSSYTLLTKGLENTQGALDETRLRDSLRQLTEGLVYLHSADRIHRDIKPSNIMVTRQGRLILLDFGLTTYSGVAHSGEVYGTPVYMAPEVIDQAPIGPESDWYSVGVMLYEALTLEQPFKGSATTILDAKREATSPPSRIARVSDDLDRLCRGLMQRNPKDRPDVDEVLELLGVRSVPRRRRRTRLPPSSPLVGRLEELALLQTVFESVQAGSTRTVFIHGESGLGKSELVREFGRLVQADCTLLEGRCYERESVPYKAIDGIVDALTRLLGEYDEDQVAPLMPPDAGILCQAFPVLRQIRSFGRVPLGDIKNVPPGQLRSRVFDSLRSLLAALAAQSTLLLVIDDLQWADQDSLDLLKAVMREPQAPAVLLVATVSTAGDSRKQKDVELRLNVIRNVQEIRMGPLSKHDAQLLATRLTSELGGDSVVSEEIIRQAGGNPFFIEVLLRYCYTKGRSGGLSLTDALARHIGELDGKDRELLELLSVAGLPIPRSLAARAANLSLDELRKRVDSLQNEKLLRSDGVRNTDTIEPYHRKVREVARSLPARELTAYFKRLAQSFEAEPEPDAEALARFWEGAEDQGRALTYTEIAAAHAVDVLAYDRASKLYGEAIRLRTALGDAVVDLWPILAGTLVNAGRGSEAGDAFATAAGLAQGEASLALQSKAAEQFLRCGRIDDGIKAINPILKAYGFHVPVTRGQVLRDFLKGRLRLRLRVGGLKYKRRSKLANQEALKRLDVCWAATIGLFNVDQLRGLALHSQHFRLALEAGEPMRVSRALALEATGIAAVSHDSKKVLSLLERADALASEVDSPNATGWVYANWVASLYLQGEWDAAAKQSVTTLQFLDSKCTGVQWEVQSVKLILRWVRALRGELSELRKDVLESHRLAHESGDLYSELCACSGLPNIVYLVEDDPILARRISSDAIRRWSQSGFHLQHLMDLYATTQIDLYEGDASGAFRRVYDAWPTLEVSGLFQVGLNRILMLDLLARAALAAPKQGQETRTIAISSAKKLAKEPYAWPRALAELIKAQLEEFPESTYKSAATLFRDSSMYLHARVAEALANTSGPSAIEVLASEGVKDPIKFMRILVPTHETSHARPQAHRQDADAAHTRWAQPLG